ncbi:hypothetical protein HID58_081827 [Brassica napus]|uniref:Uncharacterized protein n=1 Tax=Brassica napus TaxID=3708 RepID=A0ABQ7Y8V1_BRANA|nr:hypothetical protein HID58_081827 [Brassica napus]
MEISQLYLSNLETGRFKDVVVTRLLRFWGVGTLKKGGELMGEGGHGAVYELSIFYIARSNNHFKLCASPVSIRFTEHSSFVEVVDPAEIIRFCNYEQLRALTDTNIDLSDIMVNHCVSMCLIRLHDKLVLLDVETKHHPSDDMAVAVKLSMVPNPVVKSICSDHTNGPDDVPIIEGCPASTDPEPAHTDSVMTSTETPVNDEKAPSSM